MDGKTEKKSHWPFTVLFIGLPIFLYATGNFPRRTLLKESISIVTILAFCLILTQFFLTRTNRKMFSCHTIGSSLKIHKVFGYVFTGILLVHPFLIVVPRNFESGVDSLEAFIIIITSFNSLGIVLGICAWFLMLILGITSLLRKQLPMTYKNWRLFHTILAVLFTILALWHAINLGRHTTTLLSSFMVIAAVSGVLLLLKKYVSRSPMEQEVNK